MNFPLCNSKRTLQLRSVFADQNALYSYFTGRLRVKMTSSDSSSLVERIASLELKLDSIAARLAFIEHAYKIVQVPSQAPSNPLEKYLADYSEVHSIPSQISKAEPSRGKHHNRHHSQTEGISPPLIKKFENSEKVLDSKSFAMIKKSILLNSEEMQHMREKMIELEKEFIERVMGIEEGVAILTRLSQIMESKISQPESREHERDLVSDSRHIRPKVDSQYPISRILKKYQKKIRQPSLKNPSNFFY